jgi:MarR family transcriptional regulator, organic hydroperoxide resistance regulator
MRSPDELIRDAETIDRQLRLIQRAIRRSFQADERRAGLTGPQTQALTVLTQALRGGQDGLTVGELSERLGLAQSTVSGLVMRLEQKQLVQRQVDPVDRRHTRVVLAEVVKSYLDDAPRRGLLVDVLQWASEHERRAVLDGLGTLLRLLTGQAAP